VDQDLLDATSDSSTDSTFRL
jgi:hypothetical protein